MTNRLGALQITRQHLPKGPGRGEDRRRFAEEILAELPLPDEPGMPTTDLQKTFGLDKYTASTLLWGMLSVLEHHGFVERLVIPGQAARSWRLTDAGADPDRPRLTARDVTAAAGRRRPPPVPDDRD